MWRKRREKCCFGIYATKRRASRNRSSSGPRVASKTQSQKNKRRCPAQRTLSHTSAVVPLLTCDTEVSENMIRRQNSLLKPCESDTVSEAFIDSSYLENHVTDTNVAAGVISQTVPAATETLVQCCEIADASKLSQTMTDSDACGSVTHFKVPRKVIPSQWLEVKSSSGRDNVAQAEDRAPNMDTDERITSKKSSQADVSLTDLTNDIHGMHSLMFLLLIFF